MSNERVLAEAHMIPLSSQVLSRQMQVYGRLMSMVNSDLLRRIALSNNCIEPCNWRISKKRGRPKFQWSNVVYALILDSFEYNQSEACEYLSGLSWNQHEWKIFCQSYVRKWHH